MDPKRFADWRYQQLVWNMRWIAAEPEKTLAAEPRVAPDEVALALEDVMSIGPLDGVIGHLAAEIIDEIRETFENMSRTDAAALSTDEGVRTSAEWAAQRERARRVLEILREARDDDGLAGHV